MSSDRFWTALGLSLMLHLLLLQLPMGAGQRGMAMVRKTEAIEVRLPPRQVHDATPLPAPDIQPAPPALSKQDAQQQPGFPASQRYFKSSEVERRAEPIDLAPLIYPETAYLRHVPGKVTLRVYISERGGIDSVDVVAAEPAGIFEQAAIDAVLSSRFQPATLFGRPVKNVKTLEIRFDPAYDGP